MAERWEKERAAWVLTRAGRDKGARRRGEKLALRARQIDRREAGVGDAMAVEVVTRDVFTRNVFREEGAGNTLAWFVLTSTVLSWTCVLVGPALLLGLALYGLWWALVPRLGPLRSWPLALTGVVVSVAMAATWPWWSPEGTLNRVVTAWWNAQLPLGLLRAAWRVRAYGWAAVRTRTGKPTRKGTPALTVERESYEDAQTPWDDLATAPRSRVRVSQPTTQQSDQRAEPTPRVRIALHDHDEADPVPPSIDEPEQEPEPVFLKGAI